MSYGGQKQALITPDSEYAMKFLVEYRLPNGVTGSLPVLGLAIGYPLGVANQTTSEGVNCYS